MLPYDSITKERNILTAAWKWRGEKKANSVAINHKTPADDKQIVKTLIRLFNEADQVVAHYGDRFDNRYLRTRALFHGFPPLPNVQQIDTYKICKDRFLLNSNRLDYLGQFLGIGRKIKTDKKLWDDCMAGNKRAIREMRDYNEQDVHLLGDIYEKIAPHSTLKYKIIKENPRCGNCGGMLISQGTRMKANGEKYSRYQCRVCGKWSK